MKPPRQGGAGVHSSVTPMTGAGNFVLFCLCLCFDLVIFLDDCKFLSQPRTVTSRKQSQTLITIKHLGICEEFFKKSYFSM